MKRPESLAALEHPGLRGIRPSVASKYKVVVQNFMRTADKIYQLTYEDGTVIETTWSNPWTLMESYGAWTHTKSAVEQRSLYSVKITMPSIPSAVSVKLDWHKATAPIWCTIQREAKFKIVWTQGA